MGMYIQWKDDKVKQSFKPKKWQPMILNGKDAIVPVSYTHLTLPTILRV